MASNNITFENIRLILSIEGYSFGYQFIVRELGFWSRNMNGSIPFNCKLNINHLDVKSQLIIGSFENRNGIHMKKNVRTGLAQSELKPVLRTLYHMNEDSTAKYIGIVGDEKIIGLATKSGLGDIVFNMKNLNIFRSQDNYPSFEQIQAGIKQNPIEYPICYLHERMGNDDVPVCARATTKFLANHCSTQIPNSAENPFGITNEEYEQILYNITPIKDN